MFGFTAIDKNNILTIRRDVGETKDSAYLSVLYFEDVQPFDDYEKSPELAIFTKPGETFFLRVLAGPSTLAYVRCPLPAALQSSPELFSPASLQVWQVRIVWQIG